MCGSSRNDEFILLRMSTMHKGLKLICRQPTVLKNPPIEIQFLLLEQLEALPPL